MARKWSSVAGLRNKSSLALLILTLGAAFQAEASSIAESETFFSVFASSPNPPPLGFLV